jgi:hypothetical protein
MILQRLLVVITLLLVSASFIYLELNFKPEEGEYSTTIASHRVITSTLSTLSIRTTGSRGVEGTTRLYTLEQVKAGENLVPNPSFEDIKVLDRSSGYYEFADSYGRMPFPWGFEVQMGSPICISNSPISHGGRSSVQIVGLNPNDTVLFALPDSDYKPRIKPFTYYRLEVWVRMEQVQGPGLRLMQQFFNRSDILHPEYSFYGRWNKGDSDWVKLVFDARTLDGDNFLGDPVVEFSGIGKAWIDDIAFYELEIRPPSTSDKVTLPFSDMDRPMGGSDFVKSESSLSLEMILSEAWPSPYGLPVLDTFLIHSSSPQALRTPLNIPSGFTPNRRLTPS